VWHPAVFAAAVFPLQSRLENHYTCSNKIKKSRLHKFIAQAASGSAKKRVTSSQ
jgi:hypothetical protein